jgi:hypothetical protein
MSGVTVPVTVSPATAWEALERLRAAGLTVTAEGDTLRLKPSSLVTPDLLEVARQHKRTLLKTLAPVPSSWETDRDDLIAPGTCLDCGGPAPRDGMHRCATCRERAARQPEQRELFGTSGEG